MLVLSIICGSVACDDMVLLQDLVRTNLGGLVRVRDHISCSRMRNESIECSIHVPWKTECTACRQLKDTFTPGELLIQLSTPVGAVNVQCDCLSTTRA